MSFTTQSAKKLFLTNDVQQCGFVDNVLGDSNAGHFVDCATDDVGRGIIAAVIKHVFIVVLAFLRFNQ